MHISNSKVWGGGGGGGGDRLYNRYIPIWLIQVLTSLKCKCLKVADIRIIFHLLCILKYYFEDSNTESGIFINDLEMFKVHELYKYDIPDIPSPNAHKGVDHHVGHPKGMSHLFYKTPRESKSMNTVVENLQNSLGQCNI